MLSTASTCFWRGIGDVLEDVAREQHWDQGDHTETPSQGIGDKVQSWPRFPEQQWNPRTCPVPSPWQLGSKEQASCSSSHLPSEFEGVWKRLPPHAHTAWGLIASPTAFC